MFPKYKLTCSYHVSLSSSGAESYDITRKVLLKEVADQLGINAEITVFLRSFKLQLHTNHSVNLRVFALDSNWEGTDFIQQWVELPKNQLVPVKTGYIWPRDSQNEGMHKSQENNAPILEFSLGAPVSAIEERATGLLSFDVLWTRYKDDNKPEGRQSVPLMLVPFKG